MEISEADVRECFEGLFCLFPSHTFEQILGALNTCDMEETRACELLKITATSDGFGKNKLGEGSGAGSGRRSPRKKKRVRGQDEEEDGVNDAENDSVMVNSPARRKKKKKGKAAEAVWRPTQGCHVDVQWPATKEWFAAVVQVCRDTRKPMTVDVIYDSLRDDGRIEEEVNVDIKRLRENRSPVPEKTAAAITDEGSSASTAGAVDIDDILDVESSGSDDVEVEVAPRRRGGGGKRKAVSYKDLTTSEEEEEEDVFEPSGEESDSDDDSILEFDDEDDDMSSEEVPVKKSRKKTAKTSARMLPARRRKAAQAAQEEEEEDEDEDIYASGGGDDEDQSADVVVMSDDDGDDDGDEEGGEEEKSPPVAKAAAKKKNPAAFLTWNKAANAKASTKSSKKAKTTKTTKATGKGKAKAKGKGKSSSRSSADDGESLLKANPEDLPVITQPQDMFTDLIKRCPEVADVARALNGRPLKVATMCSGTESPLLALDMICKATQEVYGVSMSVEHAFSCEIEPFKQAYIERNFKPPILFRDIRELGREKATTAFGALVDVPGEGVDMLIAGTSCVDYSNLNNEKKDLDQSGESGQTFRGMMQWVAKYRPPFVILENVCGAPWERVKQRFEQHDYHAEFKRVDTKLYYIPHTRTRVYLLAFDARRFDDADIPQDAMNMVKSLARPSSESLEAYMLPSDDPRVHIARQRMAKPQNERKGRSVDWNRCESRHQRARLEEELGVKRPLTSWEEGGQCRLPDFAWNDWGRAQVDRVLDLMDINTLRLAKLGTDNTYKTLVWNLSQNVDRTTGSVRPGICPCLTPSMVPYVTNRGGPLIGLEALSLQGIPVDDLLLTRESEDQMADLAGNAMTTTVVGTCMLTSLVKGLEALKRKGGKHSDKVGAGSSSSAAVPPGEVGATAVDCDDAALVRAELDLADEQGLSVEQLLDNAQRSARLCTCEGRDGISSQQLFACGDCSHTICDRCKGLPEHSLVAHTVERVTTLNFERQFKKALPMRIALAGFAASALSALRESAASDVDETLWLEWVDAVSALENAEFRFLALNRSEIWKARYATPDVAGAVLELILDPAQPEWQIRLQPPAERGPLRDCLCRPVARLFVNRDMSENLVSGAGAAWQVCLPTTSEFSVVMRGTGEKMESWAASLGLRGDFAEEERFSEIEIEVPSEASAVLDGDLAGRYRLLTKCGGACNSLHKKVSDEDEKPVYLFLDPTRCGGPETDGFVFALNHRRTAYGEHRNVIAQLDLAWRPNAEDGDHTVDAVVHGEWLDVPGARFEGVSCDGAAIATPSAPLQIALSQQACAHPKTVLCCELPTVAGNESLWLSEDWADIPLESSRATFEALSWVTERLELPSTLRGWMPMAADEATLSRHCVVGEDGSKTSPCESCAPSLPGLKWVSVNGKKLQPLEDVEQAGAYEQAMKHRPNPFVMQLCHQGALGMARVAVNAASLVHRSLARLPKGNGELALSWRIVEHQERLGDLPPLTLTSNRQDPAAAQPPHFRKCLLRPEQLRSLHWMLAQEATEEPLVEEEVAEAVLQPLRWRAEGRAQLSTMVRGGVLADQVGYGKTAISLGLIDASPSDVLLPPPADIAGRKIPVKATLILAPAHLLKQWPKEVKKFCGSHFRVVVINTLADFNKLTIADIEEADIVFAASSVFRGKQYFPRLAALAGAKTQLPTSAGRYFDESYTEACRLLGNVTADLMGGGKDGVRAAANAVREGRKAREQSVVEGFGKRLKGKALIDKKDDKNRIDHEAGPSKKKAKTSKKGSSSAAGGLDDDEEEDEEDEEKSSKSSKKRKAAQMKKADDIGDPWELGKTHTRKNWKSLKSPPLEMFFWKRVVVDEFTYLTGNERTATVNLRSTFKWCLSGTPPVKDFGDIKGVAGFLGVHLGVAELKTGRGKGKDQTQAEMFQFYREMRSEAWHARRHELAQSFLQRFVRQNVAEIDEIPTSQQIVDVHLPPAERAIYLELEHHLQAMDMKAKKAIKSKSVAAGDREDRLRAILGASGSAEEALLKRCSHFDLAGASDSALETCTEIVSLREEQLEACKDDLVECVRDANAHRNEICKLDRSYANNKDGEGANADVFLVWLNTAREQSCGDEGAHDILLGLLEQGGVAEVTHGKPKKAGSGSGEGKTKKAAEQLMENKWSLREKCHHLRRLVKELVGRVRSLRYFQTIRDLQQAEGTGIQTTCPSCSSDVPASKQAVLSCCGHMGCRDCLYQSAERQECPTAGCSAAARTTSVVKAEELGVDKDYGPGGRFGTKLTQIIDRVKAIDGRDRILIFVQFPDLMKKVAEALGEAKIKYLELKGSVHTKTNALEAFQAEELKKGDARVLLLNIIDESASGANLTTANHAIFVHPLLAETQQEFTACETQAIGRIRRYGQDKDVTIWRYHATDTIDTDIFSSRTPTL